MLLPSPEEAQNPRIADGETPPIFQKPPEHGGDGEGGGDDDTTHSKSENQVTLAESIQNDSADNTLNPLIQSQIHPETELNLDSIAINLKRKASEMNPNQNETGFKRRYSRRELEDLRYANLEEQRRVWSEVCLAVGSFVDRFAESGVEAGEELDRSRTLDELGKLSVNVQVAGKVRRRYSRNEIECIRFVNVEEQQRVWSEVYRRLGQAAAREYDATADNKVQKQAKKKASGKKKKNNHISSEDCLQEFGNFSGETTLHLACSSSANGESSIDRIAVNECDNDIGNESEDEFDSIQKPAFHVEGDPDFDSGPPQDGLEYLRRVRWETAQIPKVKVVKLAKILKSEQSAYMPIIPDIAKCPEHLLPSKLWEDAFLADFTELRLALARLDSLNLQKSDYLQKHFNIKEDNSKFFSGDPMLSTILGMDVVSRTSALKSHIRSFEDMSTLTRNVCAWLYALCAVVDTPLDADTGASLRCLLRKCAKLRSEKSDCDDEVVMLNILVTISGKYFGQSES